MQEKQNLFTQLSDILRKAGDGNALSLEVDTEGEKELNVSVELRNKETGETVVSRFHVTGEPEILDSNFGKIIVQPLKDGQDEGGALKKMDTHMEELQRKRDEEKEEEKKKAAADRKKTDDGRANVFKALWTQAVGAKNEGKWVKARDTFMKALEIAGPNQVDAVKAQIEWCERHYTGVTK